MTMSGTRRGSSPDRTKKPIKIFNRIRKESVVSQLILPYLSPGSENPVDPLWGIYHYTVEYELL
jgi:hypothetical protein